MGTAHRVGVVAVARHQTCHHKCHWAKLDRAPTTTALSLTTEGGSFRAGESIRTPDIHVGNVLSSNPDRVLRVSRGVQHMHLMRLWCVDA